MNWKENRRFWLLLAPLAVLEMYLCYEMRQDWRWWHARFQSYPSDIWYIHINYGYFLTHAQPGFFAMEYPAGLFVFVKLMSLLCSSLFGATEGAQIQGVSYKIYTYSQWLGMNCFFLGLAGLGLVWCMHRLEVEFFRFGTGRLLWGFLLTPTFFYFTFFNYDLLPVFCSVAAFLWFLRRDELWSFLLLGLGAAVKLAPAVLAPAFWMALPRDRRLPAALVFLLGLACMNVPLALIHPQAWLYPYTWQMKFDAETDQLGRLAWSLSQYMDRHAAQALLAAGFLAAFWWMLRHRPAAPAEPAGPPADPVWLARACLLLLLSFVLFKTVYSPQYFLWLLPFATLGTGLPWWGLATFFELVNISEAFRLDYWRSGRMEQLALIRAVREGGLGGLLGLLLIRPAGPRPPAPPGIPPGT